MLRISSRITLLYKFVMPLAILPSALVITILTLLDYLIPKDLFIIASIFLLFMAIIIAIIAIKIKRLYYDVESGTLKAIGYYRTYLFDIRNVVNISRYFNIFFGITYVSTTNEEKTVFFLPKFFQQLETGMLGDPEDIILLKNEIQKKRS